MKDKKALYAAPFFVVLIILTIVAFIIPLRPTRSYSEKRSLAEFPEFSVEALTSGSYFDDISIWFSDTFPGRESWIEGSVLMQSLHGYTNVTIHGQIKKTTRPSSSRSPQNLRSLNRSKRSRLRNRAKQSRRPPVLLWSWAKCPMFP